HVLILDSHSKVWAWGNNYTGQLGDGTTTDRHNMEEVKFSALEQINDGAKIISISAGAGHSLAIDSHGRVWAWGGTGYGQLGNASFEQSQIPTLVNQTNLGGKAIVAAIAGTGISVALDESGGLWVWGQNRYGRFGMDSINYFETHSQPTPISWSGLGSANI